MSYCSNDIERILYTEQELDAKVSELGQIITEKYADKRPIVVCILKGSVVFYAQLCKKLDCDMQMDFMVASSYFSGTESVGEIKIKKDLENDIAGRHVILVEDIIDSGNTLFALKELLKTRNPLSLKIVTLLNKQDRREADIKADYCGFDIPNEFVVGYGLDYDEKYRNLPYVGILKRDIYS